ncbi:MAG TPA: SRPBCC family protein [Micromonospora sp.]|nr:SRPBCC family protein [Micromonospora sp.]
MGAVTEQVDVAVPVRTAYNQWTQFEEFPRFMQGVRQVRQISDTMTRWMTEIAGVRREFDAEVTEQVPDERVAWKAVGGVRQAGVVTFERLDDTHTRVIARLEVEPHGFVEQTGDRLGMIGRRVREDLQRFKGFIESRGGAETGGWRGEIDGRHRGLPR